MTSIARDSLKPIRTRMATLDRRATRVARDADRALSRIEDEADEIFDNGWSIAKDIHARIEERPHAAFLAALAIGAAVALLSRFRR